MRIAAIGAGRWGKNIIKTLSSLEVLAAISDVSEETRESLKKQYPDLRVVADYHELIGDDKIDAVAIATPVPTHYQVSREALSAGKDVFVEKPLTLKVSEAEELVKLADQHQRILMVGHLLLYQPAIQWIKQYLDGGDLGTVYSIHQERLNLGKVRKVENTLWSLGVHDIAVINYLFGKPPVHINASGHSVLQPEIEDDQFLHMYFEDNIQAHLHTSWLWPEKRRVMTVIGSKGMLVYNELEQKVYLYKNTVDDDLTTRNEGSEVVFEGAGQPLTLEMQHFMDCVSNRAKPKSDGRSGLEVVKVLHDATELLSQNLIPS